MIYDLRFTIYDMIQKAESALYKLARVLSF